MYGGEASDGSMVGDVSVLTVPGFHWFSTNAQTDPRITHACALVGKRQMAVVGGVATPNDWKTADPWVNGLGILDLTSLEWKSGYDPDAGDYDSPQMVKQWYEDK